MNEDLEYDELRNSPKTLLRKRSMLFRHKTLKSHNKKTFNRRERVPSYIQDENKENFGDVNLKIKDFDIESPIRSKVSNSEYKTPEKKTTEFFETPKKQKSMIYKKEMEYLDTPKAEKDYITYSTFKSPKLMKWEPDSEKKRRGSEMSIEDNSFSRFDEDYEVLRVLGAGNFGCVYKCMKHIDGDVYAVKVIKQKMRGGMATNALNEVISLSAFTNSVEDKNIVRYYNAWIESKQLYIVMEYCSQSLREYQKSNPIICESMVRKIARDISIALKHLHENKLVHLDIKPADFGLARIAYISAFEDIDEGDSRYLAPEIMNTFNQDISKADIFSLGITLFEIMTGEQLPLNGDRWHQLRKRTISLNELNPITNYSDSMKKLVSQMMSENTNIRPSANSLLNSKCFQSDTILELKWQKLIFNIRKQRLEELEKIKSPIRKMTF